MKKVSAELFSRTGDQFLGRVYKNNDFDCQDFVEQVMHKLGIADNLPGSNAWYRRMTWVGTPKECIQKFGIIPKGALLFILKQDGGEPEKYKADRIGNASHIGIKTGRTGMEMVANAVSHGVSNANLYNYGDGAIHSSSSRGHVVTSNFSDREINGGWNRVGLWDRFDYGDRINAILSGGQPQQDDTPEKGYAIVTERQVALRLGPSTAATVIIRVPIGEKVKIENPPDSWEYVSYNGKSGYMMKQFLKE